MVNGLIEIYNDQSNDIQEEYKDLDVSGNVCLPRFESHALN
jgi:hypothetical protein